MPPFGVASTSSGFAPPIVSSRISQDDARRPSLPSLHDIPPDRPRSRDWAGIPAVSATISVVVTHTVRSSIENLRPFDGREGAGVYWPRPWVSAGTPTAA